MATTEDGRKNVSLTLETYERLKKIGTAGDSLGDMVKLLLDEHDEQMKKKRSN